MQYLIVLLSLFGAGACFKASATCHREYADSMEKFMDATNAIWKSSRVDLDRIQNCAVEELLSCAEDNHPKLKPFFKKKDQITRCIETEVDRRGGAVDKLVGCIKRDFRWFVVPNFFGPVQSTADQPGLRMVGIGALIYRLEGRCPRVKKCLPRNADSIRRQVCEAQKDSFAHRGHDTRTTCVQVQTDFRDTACSCWKKQDRDNLKAISNILKCSKLPAGLVAKKLDDAAKKAICNLDVQKAFDTCA